MGLGNAAGCERGGGLSFACLCTHVCMWHCRGERTRQRGEKREKRGAIREEEEERDGEQRDREERGE